MFFSPRVQLGKEIQVFASKFTKEPIINALYINFFGKQVGVLQVRSQTAYMSWQVDFLSLSELNQMRTIELAVADCLPTKMNYGINAQKIIIIGMTFDPSRATSKNSLLTPEISLTHAWN